MTNLETGSVTYFVLRVVSFSIKANHGLAVVELLTLHANNKRKYVNGEASSARGVWFAIMLEIQFATSTLFAALPTTKFKSGFTCPRRCNKWLVFNSLPISFHNNVAYSLKLAALTSFSLHARASTFTASSPETIALPMPSPENGSIKPAASPNNKNPTPGIVRCLLPKGK